MKHRLLKLSKLLKTHKKSLIFGSIIFLITASFTIFILVILAKPNQPRPVSNHIITVYDRGEKSVFLSNAKTVGQALKENSIEIDPHDAVEPGLDEELVADDYWVNIYRARPVVVIDGATRVKTMTPYQTADQIAKDVGIKLYPEDGVDADKSNDLIGEGAGIELKITRSVPISLNLYGKTTTIRTLGKTVGDMLAEKGVELSAKDKVSIGLDTNISQNMYVRVWREGKQTISYDEPLAYKTRQIQDADRYVNYHKINTEGKNGIQTISYEVEVKDGVELSRKEIARIVATEPTTQIETIGIKSFPGALSKDKGAQFFTDSKGVIHRETYYDLDMGRVMLACGQGGKYYIRIDGVKVDADGYAIVAANLNTYPRCSVVETSVGPAKVYDTGGFALRWPTGFDIATDWSNYNGR